MWKFEPVENISNCMESIMASLVKFYCNDYPLYNLKFIYTKYFDAEKNKFTFVLSYDFIQKFFGIQGEIMEAENMKNDIVEEIRSQITKKPVCVIVDPFYCHWSPFYQTDHWTHAMLIKDENQTDQKLTCFDVYYSDKGNVEISFDELRAAVFQMVVFQYEQKNINVMDVAVDHIKDIIREYDREKTKQEINDLIDVIIREMEPYKMKQIKSMETSKLLIRFLCIAEHKQNAIKGLKYLEKVKGCSVFDSACELFENSNRQFLLLKTFLMRYAITGLLNRKSLSSIIQMIYDLDQLMVAELNKAIEIF